MGQGSYDANGCQSSDYDILISTHAMLSALLSALFHLVITSTSTSTSTPVVSSVPMHPSALTHKLPIDHLQSSLEHGTPEAFAITVGSTSVSPST